MRAAWLGRSGLILSLFPLSVISVMVAVGFALLFLIVRSKFS